LFLLLYLLLLLIILIKSKHKGIFIDEIVVWGMESQVTRWWEFREENWLRIGEKLTWNLIV